MKKLFLSVCLSISTFLASAKSTVYEKPVVDERMELMGIIFRYVGIDLYADDYLPTFCKEIDKHFDKYKNHPVIKMSERQVQFGASFHAIADFAISLEIKNNQIVLNDKLNKDILYERWQKDSIPKYLILLNDFYKKTDFHKFFGYTPKHKYRIIISLITGNYGISAIYKDGSEEYYSIILCAEEDNNGLPTFQANTFMGTENKLIHEFCHSFCDEPINKYLDKLMPQATILFELNKEKLTEMYYGSPKSLLNELFVRAAVFQYQKDNNVFDYFNVKSRVNEGFLGLYQLLDCFEKYSNDTNHKNLIDFMPEIVKHLNSYDFKKIYYEEIPEVKYASIENNSENIDCNLDSITLYFNTEMYKYDKATLSIRSTPKLELIEVSKYRDKVIGKDKWSEDGKAWTFYFKKLQPDTQYEIRLDAFSFLNKNDTYILKDTYILTFRTRKIE